MSVSQIFTIATLLVACLPGMGQEYITVNRALNQDGVGVIHLDARPGDGIAWLRGREFSEGKIEVDVKGKDLLQQSFVGIAFHGLNDTTFEVIYFRPFNFRASDAVRKAHAVQYVALPSYDWSRLRTEHPGIYEQPVDPAPEPNEWFHAKIVVTKDKISVFVNGNERYSLEVSPLVHSAGKQIGYWVGNGSDGNWKNLRIGN